MYSPSPSATNNLWAGNKNNKGVGLGQTTMDGLEQTTVVGLGQTTMVGLEQSTVVGLGQTTVVGFEGLKNNKAHDFGES